MTAARHFFLYTIASFICTHTLAQALQPEWGDQTIKTRDMPIPERIVKGQPDELIVVGIKKRPNALNEPDTYVAVRYDKHFKQVAEKKLFSAMYHGEFQDIHNFKGNVFLFTRHFNRRDRMSTLYSIQLHPATLEVIDSNVIRQYKAKNRSWEPETSIKISQDTSHVLAFAETPHRSQIEPRVFYISVMDHRMNKLWDKAITLPYPNLYFEISRFDISNDGEVYIIVKHYDRGVTRERVRENGASVAAYSYKILRIGKNDQQPHEHVVDAPNIFIHDMGLQIDAYGDIYLPGLYRNKAHGNISGHFMAVLDKKSKQAPILKRETFPVNDLLKQMSKDRCAEIDPDDPGLLYRFKVMGTNLRSDGSVDLLTEQNYSYEEREGSITDSNRTTQTHRVYVAGNILVINHKKDGSTFYTRVPKSQKEDHSAIHISFKWMKNGDALLLFYLDNENNVKRDLSKASIPMFLLQSVFVVATITVTGALQREVAYSHKELDMVTLFQPCAVVDTDVLALFAIRGGLFSKTKFQFGRLRF